MDVCALGSVKEGLIPNDDEHDLHAVSVLKEYKFTTHNDVIH